MNALKWVLAGLAAVIAVGAAYNTKKNLEKKRKMVEEIDPAC